MSFEGIDSDNWVNTHSYPNPEADGCIRIKNKTKDKIKKLQRKGEKLEDTIARLCDFYVEILKATIR
jgi:hypothetical protein